MGDRGFSDVTIKARLADFNGYARAVAGDHDNDDRMDIIVAECFSATAQNTAFHLYRNHHDGTPTDMAMDVGLDIVVAWMITRICT